MGLEYAFLRKGPLTMAPSQVGAFARSSPEYETPNLQFHFQPLSLDKWGDGLHPFAAFTASVANLRPTSRGSVHAASPDPSAPPVDQAELSRERRGPPRRGRGAQAHAAHRGAKAARALQAERAYSGRREGERRRSHPRRWRSRHDDLPSGRHGRAWAPRMTATPCSTKGFACAALPACASSMLPRCRGSPRATPTRRRIMIAEKGAMMMREDAASLTASRGRSEHTIANTCIFRHHGARNRNDPRNDPMSLELYLAFVAATVILILIPGPNVALIVANSVAHGSRYGLLTVSGTSSAVVIQLLLTVAGMTTFLSVMAELVRMAALDRRRLSHLSRDPRLARAARRFDEGEAGAALGARDLFARLPRVAQQSEDASVLRRLLSAIRQRRGRSLDAARRARGDLLRHRRRARRHLGAPRRTLSRRARRKRQASQSADGRPFDRRRRRPRPGAQIISASLDATTPSILRHARAWPAHDALRRGADQ